MNGLSGLGIGIDGGRAAGERLPPGAVQVWRIEAVLGTILALGALGVAVAMLPWLRPLVTLVVAVTVVILVAAVMDVSVLVVRRHAGYRFWVRHEAVRIERGLILRTCTVIPREKILYVQICRGPVLSCYGLATIKIGTIGEPLTLGPISLMRSEEIQREIGAEPHVGSR